MHRDGYGFVTPDAATLDPRLKAQLSGDIFIPPPAVGSAMHGDRVLVEVGAIRPDGRAEGRIVRPVVRAHSTVVGIFHHGNRGNYVTPTDQKISQEIVIPPGMEYPEEQSSAAISRTVPKLVPSEPGRRYGFKESEIRRSRSRRRSRPPRNGTISKGWWWMLKLPTGRQPRRIRGEE